MKNHLRVLTVLLITMLSFGGAAFAQSGGMMGGMMNMMMGGSQRGPGSGQPGAGSSGMMQGQGMMQ